MRINFFNSSASLLSRLQFIYTCNIYTTRTTSAVLSTTLLHNKYNHCHVELVKLIYDKQSWHLSWKYHVADNIKSSGQKWQGKWNHWKLWKKNWYNLDFFLTHQQQVKTERNFPWNSVLTLRQANKLYLCCSSLWKTALATPTWN